MFSGMLAEGISFESAREGVLNEIKALITEGPGQEELEKVKNKIEMQEVAAESNILSKAMNLAYYELLGDANMVNQNAGKYRGVTSEDIKRVAADIFVENNLSELRYERERM
jgi:predicted Zn-dependent peptidase